MSNPFRDWNEVTADDHNRRVAACKKVPAALMTLTLTGKCKGCGKKISKEAEFCPSCIAPTGKPCPASEFGEAYARTFTTKPTSKPRKPLLNKTEARFLDLLKEWYQGRPVGIQSITLKLSFDCRYTPDFWIVPDHVNDCDISPSSTALLRFYEVKGPFIREDSMIKLKTAAAMFPVFTFILAQYKDGKWTTKTIPPL